MHELYDIAEMLCRELEEEGRKGELTAGSLENIDKLAHALKNVYKIIEAKEEMQEEYSNQGGGSYRGGSYRGGSYARGGGVGSRGGSYRGGSYARGRGSNASRDSMGRYSSERGYSRDAEDMIAQLEDMERTAPDEMTRQSIQRLISELEQH